MKKKRWRKLYFLGVGFFLAEVVLFFVLRYDPRATENKNTAALLGIIAVILGIMATLLIATAELAEPISSIFSSISRHRKYFEVIVKKWVGLLSESR